MSSFPQNLLPNSLLGYNFTNRSRFIIAEPKFAAFKFVRFRFTKFGQIMSDLGENCTWTRRNHTKTQSETESTEHSL